jgi:hypothetical protein
MARGQIEIILYVVDAGKLGKAAVKSAAIQYHLSNTLVNESEMAYSMAPLVILL